MYIIKTDTIDKVISARTVLKRPQVGCVLTRVKLARPCSSDRFGRFLRFVY